MKTSTTALKRRRKGGGRDLEKMLSVVKKKEYKNGFKNEPLAKLKNQSNWIESICLPLSHSRNTCGSLLSFG